MVLGWNKCWWGCVTVVIVMMMTMVMVMKIIVVTIVVVMVVMVIVVVTMVVTVTMIIPSCGLSHGDSHRSPTWSRAQNWCKLSLLHYLSPLSRMWKIHRSG